MRFADIFRLSLGALWRQKARTLLTTLGVVFGSLALVISLSIGQGVQETILREASRYGDLRKVIVHPNRYGPTRQPPPEEVTVRGVMSEERRRRLAEGLRQRWYDRQPSHSTALLTAAQVQQLTGLEHVQAAIPGGQYRVAVSLDGRSDFTSLQPAPADSPALGNRLLAGDLFSGPEAREAIVSDFLLYRLGIADDAALPGVIGKKLRLEFRERGPLPVFLLTLVGSDAAVTAKDERLLGQVMERLPEALGKLELNDKDRTALQRLLGARQGGRDRLPTVELTIRGVVRPAREGGTMGFGYYDDLRGELFVPARAAEEWFAQLPASVPAGYDWVVLEVDTMEHVKGVSRAVAALGLRPDSLMERIEHERFIYLLVFGGMTVVALLVAALGIANTMLISVLERIREIGVMKAVGARDRHIQLIFLVEGAVIGLTGGLLGLLLAWGASGPCDAWVRSMLASGTSIKLERSIFVFPAWLVFSAPAFAVVVTTLAAVYPARRAARVDPVTALRHE